MNTNVYVQEASRSSLRLRAYVIKKYKCHTLICVLENPKNILNIGTVIRNIEGLGIGKLYVVDEKHIIPDDWQLMRNNKILMNTSASAIKWQYVRRFQNTHECLDYLKKKKFVSIATSPHIKDKYNVSLNDIKFTQKKLAVWFGNESYGLTDQVIQNSIMCVQIPMFGIIESLNLAVCTGIVLNIISQQRRLYKYHVSVK